MQTLLVDVINEKAMALLVGMEKLDLIHLHDEKGKPKSKESIADLKGTMTKQPIDEVNKQLAELRNAWE